MRNLAEYPITKEEMIRAVEKALRRYEDDVGKLPKNRIPCGDIHGIALHEVIYYLNKEK